MASDANRSECVSILLEAGADVNATSLGGLTPLHLACRNNCLAAVISLLKNDRVDLNAESIERGTPESMTEDPQIKDAILDFKINKK